MPPEGDRERGVWSGSISFGLVNVPVELHAVQRGAPVALRMLAPDGVPLARQYVCPSERQPVSGDELARGYPVGENQFVVVEDEELEQLAPRRSRDIELTRFVPRDALDPAWFVRSYALVPSGEQTRAYRLLADGMERTGRAAIASFVMRGKPHAVAIFADRGLLRGEILRFHDELRTPADLGLPGAEKVDADRLRAMARSIAARAADRLDEAELADASAEALRARARDKLERGEDVVRVPEAEAGAADSPGGAAIADLMALLKQRLRAPDARKPRRAARPPAKAASRTQATSRKSRSADPSARGELERASKQELYRRARELDIAGRSGMSRRQLLAALHRAS